MKKEIQVDVREVAKESMTVSVQLKNTLWFKVGLLFIKIGCWLTGAQFVDEFPMSLYQEDKDAR
ncbi:MAG TPA: hypothetical protein VFU31_27805 [Candidatus Binatia bacterium]|nr:hypothetical protein [Candidatus Binatia bacterium]